MIITSMKFPSLKIHFLQTITRRGWFIESSANGEVLVWGLFGFETAAMVMNADCWSVIKAPECDVDLVYFTPLSLSLCSRSRRTGQYNVQRGKAAGAALGSSSGKAPYQRCSSQDSLDEQAMMDYFKEVEIIQCSGDTETQEDLQLKVADGKKRLSALR